MLIDTGAMFDAELTAEILAAVRLLPSGAGPVMVNGKLKDVFLGEFRIGGNTLARKASVTETPGDPDIDGIIGMGVVQDMVLTVDGPDKSFTLAWGADDS